MSARTNTPAPDAPAPDAPAPAPDAPAPGAPAPAPASGAQTHTPGADGSHHGYIDDKQRYLNRLKRIEGQARGVRSMIEDEKYCIDILTQISALTSALEAVAVGLLGDHLRHCVVDAARQGDAEAELKIREATDAIARFVR